MKTALIIEDNPDNMELMRQLLEEDGYKVLKAETGQQGFDVALEVRPDFILLDIQLPDMDGQEVLKKIRSSEIGNSIPMIAVTSYAMAGDRERLLAAGCDGYIEKPVDPDKFVDQIREILGEKS